MKSSDRRPSTRLVLIATVATLALAAGCATPQPGAFERATLHGMVYSEQGNPVAWATVHLGADSAMTDIRGRFRIPEVARGPVELAVSADGFLPLSASALFANRSQVLYLQMRSRGAVATEIRAALESGRTDEARLAAARALTAFPEDPLFVYLLAVAELKAGRPAAAREALAPLTGSGMDAVQMLLAEIERTEADE